MALKVQEAMGVILVLMFMVLGGARAQTSTCTNTLMGLTSCLNYVTGNSSTPTPGCCSQLATIVQTQPRCLCSLLNTNNIPTFGVTINRTLAVTLPGACRVQTPPITLCNGVANEPAGAPATAPTSPEISPIGSSGKPTKPSEGTPVNETPATSIIPTIPSESGPGSKATPSTNNNTSNGSKFRATSYLLLFTIFFGMKL